MASAPRLPHLPLTTTFGQPSRQHSSATYVSNPCQNNASTSGLLLRRSSPTARWCTLGSAQPTPHTTPAASRAARTGHATDQCPATPATAAGATTAPQPCTCLRARFFDRHRRRRAVITSPLPQAMPRSAHRRAPSGPYVWGNSSAGPSDAARRLYQNVQDPPARRGGWPHRSSSGPAGLPNLEQLGPQRGCAVHRCRVLRSRRDTAGGDLVERLQSSDGYGSEHCVVGP